MIKNPDYSKLAHMLIDNKEYWEEEGLIPPIPKERHRLHKEFNERS